MPRELVNAMNGDGDFYLMIIIALVATRAMYIHDDNDGRCAQLVADASVDFDDDVKPRFDRLDSC